MITLNYALPSERSKTITHFTAKWGAQRSLLSGAAAGGFTLIELMIAIVLGMLIVVALSALFVNISRTNTEMAKTNAQIENGRFAMQLLQGDIVHAGYWGSYVPKFDDMSMSYIPANPPVTPVVGQGLAPTAVPDPCLTYNVANWNVEYQNNLIAIPLQSYAGAPTTTTCGANVVSSVEANTDVLVVRHAETCSLTVPAGVREGNCEAHVAGKVYFQSSLCELEIDGGKHFLLNKTGFDTLGTGLHKRDCVGTIVGTNPAALPIASGTFADKRKFVSNIYYVRNFNDIPTLWRSRFDGEAHQDAEPLIEGIEGFRVEFGIDSLGDLNPATGTRTVVDYTKRLEWVDPLHRDTPLNRGDGAPDGAFVHCTSPGVAPCAVSDLANVVAVKLYVLARNKEETLGHTDTKTYTLGGTTMGPFNDHYKRHVFSTTVRLNNVSARRETP